MTTQRDAFISHLFERAKKDKDIYLISVDMGASALDVWREELPGQFFSAGISEQNAINFAAGLSARGKKPYVYFMASWVARCFEQIRFSCAMGGNPITILGNGVGLGYTPAGPAHEPTEDIAYMRSLCGMEIYSPSNSLFATQLVDLTCEIRKLRYLRLERSYPKELENLYEGTSLSFDFLEKGMFPVKTGSVKMSGNGKPKVCLLSSGYLLGRTIKVWERLITEGYEATVVDFWKIKPVDAVFFQQTVRDYKLIVTIEEQTLSGGFGSAVCELLADAKYKKDVLRLGLPERFIFENASRDYLLDHSGLSVDSIFNRVIEYHKSL